MRTLIATLVVVAAASVAFAQDEKVEKEKKKFAGTWALASGEVDGKPVADEHVKAGRITYAGDAVSLVSPHQSKDPFKAKITRFDPSKKPAEMEWVRDNGPNAGKTMMAIYEWIDDDSYRICFDPSGKERPKEFKTTAGSGYIMHVWKRTK
jgi:uncharacterized protein (TIGR03067 family)